MTRCRRSERGAVLVIFALLITVLVIIMAIVIDLGATRSDRRGGQLAVDNATTAGAMALLEGGGEDACLAAVGFLEATLDVDFTFAASDCTSMQSCITPAVPLELTAPGYRAILHYPIEDTSPLLAQTSTISADSSRFIGDRPALPCARFGVQLRTTGSSYFGGIVGETERQNEVHAVAVLDEPEDPDRIINLAVLERHQCNAIELDGQGGIIAGPVVDGATVEPGTIAVDSDGEPSCGTTVSLTSNNNVVRADGPTGCSGELTPGTGEGCGRIELFADGPPGCVAPACSKHASATLAPSPQKVSSLVTRAPVDHKYDCKSSYVSSTWWSQQPDIAPCPASAVRPAYISALIAAMPATGAPAGWQVYPRPSTSDTCSHTTGPNDPSNLITVPSGNWYIDCPTLAISRAFVFQGGNLLFRGSLDVAGQADFRVNTANTTATYPWAENGAFVANQHASQAAYMYFRTGATFSKGAQAAMTINNTVGYFSSGTTITLGGGSGSLRWTAPTTGPFQDLALWSDSTVDASFGGQTSLTMEGAFFTPLSRLVYSGQGDNDVTAQFIARKIRATGQGAVNLTPTRGVPFPPSSPGISLVR